MTQNSTTQWDAIVIGTGMGGATIGYALAAAGKKVLFLEKGVSPLRATALTGDYAERFLPPKGISHAEEQATLKRAGRAWETLWDISTKKPKPVVPFVGIGAGGSSSLYGAVLERFGPTDFEPGLHFPEDKQSSLPSRWPISYEELVPYYEKAEALFGVTSAPGGASPGPANARWNAEPAYTASEVSRAGDASTSELIAFFSAKGLRPYRLAIAHDPHSRCSGCQGFLCSDNKKGDSFNCCLLPAMQRHQAAMVEECAVHALLADADAVRGVVCSVNGREAVFSANIVVLAAGALESPRILLQSRCDLWPNGLANGSGLVGRNLMRHFVDLYIVRTRAAANPQHHQKDIGFRDYYVVDGTKYGVVQSFGKLPPGAIIARDLENSIRNRSALLAVCLGLVRRWLAALLDRKFARSVILASILEDRPYAGNQVAVSDAANPYGQGSLLLHYRVPPAEKVRIERFRALMRQVLAPYRFTLIKAAEDNERLAHACGTCRFGDDPANSVLDRNNKAHGLSNLYVVDASFFPSSGGTNPSLTIAANALRVADKILARFRDSAEERLADSISGAPNQTISSGVSR